MKPAAGLKMSRIESQNDACHKGDHTVSSQNIIVDSNAGTLTTQQGMHQPVPQNTQVTVNNLSASTHRVDLETPADP